MKINKMSATGRKTIEKIAKANGMSVEKTVSAMLRPSRANGVTIHLDYGL